jgi:hypothetical protein
MTDIDANNGNYVAANLTQKGHEIWLKRLNNTRLKMLGLSYVQLVNHDRGK